MAIVEMQHTEMLSHSTGKVFPKLRRRGGRPIKSRGEDTDVEESVDYVFQIINKMSHREFRKLCFVVTRFYF